MTSEQEKRPPQPPPPATASNDDSRRYSWLEAICKRAVEVLDRGHLSVVTTPWLYQQDEEQQQYHPDCRPLVATDAKVFVCLRPPHQHPCDHYPVATPSTRPHELITGLLRLSESHDDDRCAYVGLSDMDELASFVGEFDPPRKIPCAECDGDGDSICPRCDSRVSCEACGSSGEDWQLGVMRLCYVCRPQKQQQQQQQQQQTSNCYFDCNQLASVLPHLKPLTTPSAQVSVCLLMNNALPCLGLRTPAWDVIVSPVEESSPTVKPLLGDAKPLPLSSLGV
jgi:hypothetical protein